VNDTPEAVFDRLGIVEIRLIDAELPQVVDEAEAALIKADLGIYQRGGTIVRPISAVVPAADGCKSVSHRIGLVSPTHLAEVMTSAAIFLKFDIRQKQWRAVSCPPRIAETYAARMQWALPALAGMITTPTIRADGTILCRPGYDPQTALLFDGGDVSFPPIPDCPAPGEAEAALELLTALLAEFPFLTGADRAVALAAILTALVRRSLPSAPIFCFDAPTASTGKTLLADIVAKISTGNLCPVSSQGDAPEELGKHLTASLICGDSILCIDNIGRPLGGDLLCQMLTQRTVRLRPLGTSTTLDVPTAVTMMGTGNNLVIDGDLVRRAIICRLDAQVERPELRAFEFNPIQMIADNRPAYVRAGLVIMRSYIAAGRPRPGPPLGSFEEWARMVRDPLVWLGQMDPTSTIERARASDGKIRNLAAVLEQWYAVIGAERITASALIDRALEQNPGDDRDAHGFIHPELREALLAVAAEKGFLNANRLGYWLRANAGKVVGGCRIVRDDGRLHYATAWYCERIA
jgi:putative DNA primase/helicase